MMRNLLATEEYVELQGAHCRMDDKLHRVSVDRDYPVCEDDLQSLHHKDGWMAQVGRMVWENLCIQSDTDYLTSDTTSVVSTVLATENAIAQASVQAEEDIVELSGRLVHCSNIYIYLSERPSPTVSLSLHVSGNMCNV